MDAERLPMSHVAQRLPREGRREAEGMPWLQKGGRAVASLVWQWLCHQCASRLRPLCILPTTNDIHSALTVEPSCNPLATMKTMVQPRRPFCFSSATTVQSAILPGTSIYNFKLHWCFTACTSNSCLLETKVKGTSNNLSR